MNVGQTGTYMLLLFAYACGLFLILVSFAVDKNSRKRSERINHVLTRTAGGTLAEPRRTGRTMRRNSAHSVFGGAASMLIAVVPQMKLLNKQLERANIAVGVVDFCAFGMLFGFVLTVFLVSIGNATWAFAAPVGALVAFGSLYTFVLWRVRAEEERFIKEFPDALDLIIRGVKTGIPLVEAMRSASMETKGRVAEILQDIIGNISLGMSLDHALLLSTKRIAVQEFKFFVVSVNIQQETGGNIAEVMQNLASIIRRREQLRLKIKAMSSEARASAIIIGSLPFIMFVIIWFINREYILRFFTDRRGWILLTAAICSLLTGAGVMMKMTRFKI